MKIQTFILSKLSIIAHIENVFINLLIRIKNIQFIKKIILVMDTITII